MTWSKAYGHADLAAGRPLTVDAVNRAESISKSLTAWGVMALVEADRLRLDDPVSCTRGLGVPRWAGRSRHHGAAVAQPHRWSRAGDRSVRPTTRNRTFPPRGERRSRV